MTRLLDQPQAMPPEHRFSRAQYYRMADMGLFLEERVELIDGRITLMPPEGNYHDVAITLGHELLLRTFDAGYWVRAQMSLDLAPMSAPEHRFAEPKIFPLLDSVAPLALPSAFISIAQLFPSVRNAK